MTEIKIEKKKSIWPWLLLFLGIIAAIWFFFFRNEEIQPDNTKETTEKNEMLENNEMNSNSNAVSAYTMLIEEHSNEMGLDHEFTSEAITKLANAVEAKAAETNFDITENITKAKQLAKEITEDPMSTNHADKIRNAADILSTSLQNIQEDKFPNITADSQDVKRAAAAINPKILTLDQKEAVKYFFSKSADLLTKMN